MKMKKLTVVAMVAMVALLGSLAANATVVFNDTFAGTSGAAEGDINGDLAIRQALGTTSSSYTLGGTANGALSLYYYLYSYQTLTSPVGGDHVTMDLDTDFGSSLAGNQWSLSYRELQAQTTAEWGGWSAVHVGNTRGLSAGAEFGAFFRPNGEWFITTEGGLIAAGAGTLLGATTYDVEINFDEVANTVSVSQQIHDDSLPAFDLGTYALNFAGGSRYVQYRTHVDGGTAALLQTLQDDIQIEVVPEPATLGLFALIGGGMLWIRKRMAI